MKRYILQTENLHMRPIESNDAALLWPYVSDPSVSKNMSWDPHEDIEETYDFIEGTLKGMNEGRTITWCIFYQDAFCGIFSLISILRTHRALTYDRAEMAYWIGSGFQGKGIMTEAGKKVLDFAFNELCLNKIVVGHHECNIKSRNLILRLGFRFAYDEEQVFKKHGSWINCKFYELKAKEYLKE